MARLNLGLRHGENIHLLLPDGREIVLSRGRSESQTPRICIEAPLDVYIERRKVDRQSRPDGGEATPGTGT